MRFFDRFRGELAEKNIELPATALEDDEYFGAMSRAAMSPDGLFEAVYAIEAMATEEGQDRLERAVASGELALTFDERSSRGDMAVQAYLAAPEVLAQKNNEMRLARLSSFEYYGAKKPVDRSDSFSAPSRADRLRVLVPGAPQGHLTDIARLSQRRRRRQSGWEKDQRFPPEQNLTHPQ